MELDRTTVQFHKQSRTEFLGTVRHCVYEVLARATKRAPVHIVAGANS